jgi:predicted CXXCH cytochrome family protein
MDRVPTATDFLKITCTVCHDPHGGDIPGQLRAPLDSPDPNVNLCTKCHNRNVTMTATTWRGPHSFGGQLLLGQTIGWRPPGMTTDKIVNTHGDESSNPKLCVTCHMAKPTVNDADGTLIRQSTGHLFLASPCTDENGVPTGEHHCAQSERDYSGCATGGCHGSPTVARSLLTTSEIRINSKLAELKALLENTGKVACSEFTPSSTAPISVARGARFNYLLAVGHVEFVADATCPGPNADTHYRAIPAPIAAHGSLVHNPPLLEALLQASIDAVRQQYYGGFLATRGAR